MATLNEIGAALATAASGAVGVNEYDAPVESPQTPSVECIFLGRRPVDMCGGQVMEWAIELSVTSDAPGWDETGRAMRDFLDVDGNKSVEAALVADRTLGGLVDTIVVTRVEGAALVTFGDGRRWLARVLLELWT